MTGEPYAVRFSPPAAKVLGTLPGHVEDIVWDVLDAAASAPYGIWPESVRIALDPSAWMPVLGTAAGSAGVRHGHTTGAQNLPRAGQWPLYHHLSNVHL